MSDSHIEIEEHLRWLHTSLAPGEQIYIGRGDDPELNYAVDTLEQATQLSSEWEQYGVFCSTGTFRAGTRRTKENLLAIPALVLDCDLKDKLVAEGVDADTADAKIRQCSPEILARLCEKHRQLIAEALAAFSLTATAEVFTGGGHHC